MHEPLFGARCAVSVIPGFLLQLLDAIFRSTKLGRKLVCRVHGAVAFVPCDVRCPVQQSQNGLGRFIKRVRMMSSIPALRAERHNLRSGICCLVTHVNSPLSNLPTRSTLTSDGSLRHLVENDPESP